MIDHSKDKARYQTRIELESKMPKPKKREKVKLAKMTQSDKNKKFFDRLEQL